MFLVKTLMSKPYPLKLKPYNSLLPNMCGNYFLFKIMTSCLFTLYSAMQGCSKGATMYNKNVFAGEYSAITNSTFHLCHGYSDYPTFIITATAVLQQPV